MAVTFSISMSLDGYIAGPNQGPDQGLGEGGEALHEWAYELQTFHEVHGREGGEANTDDEVLKELFDAQGAVIMGRNMFGGGTGPWDESWKGWWGDEPPFHAPVFVLTHHPRDPLPMQGGTTFTFVTDGIEAALDGARAAAAGEDVAVAGGASTIQQYLAAGLLDELYLHIVPIVLGGGDRLLENVGDPKLEPVEVLASPGVTHVKYRVVR